MAEVYSGELSTEKEPINFGNITIPIIKGNKGDKGEKGDKGDTGKTGAQGKAFTYEDFTEEQLELLKGEKGDVGETGDKGDKGDTGDKGPKGDKGDKGDAGSSAYEIAQKNGFEGTEQEWLDSLKGNEIISDGVAEGESITITDAGNLPIEHISLEGKTYQETREGRNKLNLEELNVYLKSTSVTYDIKGTNSIEVSTTANNSYQNIAFQLDLEDGDYIGYIGSASVSNSDMTIKRMTISYYKNDTRTAVKHIDVGSTVNFSIVNEDEKIYVVEFWGNYSTKIENTIVFEDCYIAKETTFSGYEKYGASPSIEFPSEIQSVTGENKFIFNNKNLAIMNPIDEITKNGLTYSIKNSTITLNGTATASFDFISSLAKFKLKAGTYTMQLKENAGKYLVGNSWIFKLQGAGVSYDLGQYSLSAAFRYKQTFTITEEKEVYFISWINKDAIFDNYSISIQLEEGDTATDYIEHQSQNYPISLGEIEIFEDGYLNIEYEETLGYKSITKASIVNSYGKIILDGTTNTINYKHASIATETNAFFQLKLPAKKKTATIDEKCNYLKVVRGSAGNAIKENCLWHEDNSEYVYLSIPFLTIAEANAWLQELNTAGTPLEIVYPLETPVETEIKHLLVIQYLNGLLNAETYRNVTHINSINEGLKPTIKIGYNFAKGLISDEEIKQTKKDFELIDERVNEINNELSKILLACYPVGSYYWSTKSTDPSSLFGGAWERVKDKFIYALGDEGTAGESGGVKIYTSVSHIDEQQAGLQVGSAAYSGKILVVHDESVMNQKEITPVHEKAYCWKRIA